MMQILGVRWRARSYTCSPVSSKCAATPKLADNMPCVTHILWCAYQLSPISTRASIVNFFISLVKKMFGFATLQNFIKWLPKIEGAIEKLKKNSYPC